MSDLPERTHVYQCHHFDSTRWDYYEPRDDDIIIATSYKAGTTWAQAIIAHRLTSCCTTEDTYQGTRSKAMMGSSPQ